MKKEEIEKLAERDLHPQLIDQLVFWEDRGKNSEIFKRIEDLWALQYWHKYKSLRKVGFSKTMAFIMILRVMK